jgi:hypothetical protein
LHHKLIRLFRQLIDFCNAMVDISASTSHFSSGLVDGLDFSGNPAGDNRTPGNNGNFSKEAMATLTAVNVNSEGLLNPGDDRRSEDNGYDTDHAMGFIIDAFNIPLGNLVPQVFRIQENESALDDTQQPDDTQDPAMGTPHGTDDQQHAKHRWKGGNDAFVCGVDKVFGALTDLKTI